MVASYCPLSISSPNHSSRSHASQRGAQDFRQLLIAVNRVGTTSACSSAKPLKPTHVIDEHFGDRILRCIDSVNQVFHNLLLDDLRVWPLYDVLCFAIVPPAIGPAATSAVSVCWHTYVAYVANRKAGCVAAVA